MSKINRPIVGVVSRERNSMDHVPHAVRGALDGDQLRELVFAPGQTPQKSAENGARTFSPRLPPGWCRLMRFVAVPCAVTVLARSAKNA
jgi:hypothetical protein